MTTISPTITSGVVFGNMDMLKSQILTMFALNNRDGSNGIFNALYAIIILTVIEHIFKYLPVIIKNIEILFKTYIERKINIIKPITNTIEQVTGKQNIVTIYLCRNYEGYTSDNKKTVDINDTEIVDAMIDYICTLDTTQHLRYSNKFFINNKDEIIINKDITAQVERLDIEMKSDVINAVGIRLKSSTLKLSQLREFINKVLFNYRIEISNKLGKQKYYFNEFHVEPMRDIKGSYRYETAPKRITFNMMPFNTYKSMNNIYGNHINEIKNRIEQFIHHPEWYSKRGIPHTLGLLLHGNPGCGKTSLIKAIAKDTNRHVFNINLRKTTTQRQLLNLFFEENVTVMNSGNETVVITIPLDQRIYVIEDIDCLTDVVLDRKYLELIKSKNTNINNYKEFLDDNDLNIDNINKLLLEENDKHNLNNIEDDIFNQPNQNYSLNYQDEMMATFNTLPQINKDKSNKKIQNIENKDEITLSFLLNLLDGVLETPGRILIMTSNYPKRLDKALIRPGRIDMNVHFTNADNNMIAQMIHNFYNTNITIQEIQNILHNNLHMKFTPAKIIEVLCNNYNDYKKAIEQLNNLSILSSNN